MPTSHAAQSHKPTVHLAIATGWFEQMSLIKGRPKGVFDCSTSLCHYSVVSASDNPAPDYSTFDGVLHYSGEGLPPVPDKPANVSWFKRGFIWEEPNNA